MKKNNKKRKLNNNNNKNHMFIIMSIVVFLSCVILISFKKNFHIDEICSYGLANNQFQLLIKDFKLYSGPQLINDYLTVHEGYQFDFANLVFNQVHDTHPPLWYCILHIICSIFVGTFSKWYGLIINCVFMIVVYWKMFHLVKVLTKDKMAAYFIPFLSMFLYGFINAIVFTRMYILLQAITLTFVCLLIDKMIDIRHKNMDAPIEDKNISNNKILLFLQKEKFAILFYVLTVLGVLTQYHYMVIAGLMCLIFGIFLLIYKEYKLLIKSMIAGVLGLFTSYAIFPYMLDQIFYNKKSLHSFNRVNRNSDFTINITTFFGSLRRAFFGNTVAFVILLSIVLGLIIVLVVKNKKSNKTLEVQYRNIFSKDNVFIMLIFSFVSISYYMIMVATVYMAFDRYLFNLYPILAVTLFSFVFLLLKNIKDGLKYCGLLFIIICAICSNTKLPVHLYYSNGQMIEFMKEHKDIRAIMAYYEGENGTQVWKLTEPLYPLKDLEQVVFVNTAIENWTENELLNNNENLFVFVYTDIIGNMITDEDIINKLGSKNNLTNSMLIYKNASVHLYLLY